VNLHVVLYQPEIPPNTGNIIRLCANAGARLHLIQPLGFAPDDARLRRAGLDYRDWVEVTQYPSLEALRGTLPGRLLPVSTRGAQQYDQVVYGDADILLFGPETRGLPQEVIESVPANQQLRIPMRPGNRSLNLSNAVAVIVYEAWRQQGFG
jgi:tRNA (cytidine/uridine-2'-O-)-methyltransferase